MSAIERVILVDDNELDNDFHSIVLRKAGYGGELLRFETGPDLLRFLQTSPPDRRTCVFLDINMPILSGFDTADQLLTLAHAGSGLLEVHLLSSSDSLADRQRAAARPLIRSYLVKPLSVAAARAVLGLGA
ncbi:response regulator [Hydrogenophaga sp. YM1]|uniref:response regulator n=1 Tax=Hydrogenophaga sp. YM1 TaxID=2806262 RepID=UPI0019562C11|nr:response regulator [Hydrogenophaga sp. YM1]QRR34148.1 response regulator [Hydrogenophaga sp. YM1]